MPFDMGQLMQDPQFQRLVMQQIQRKKRKGLTGMMDGNGAVASLGQKLPQLKQMQEKFKIQDAERKVKKLKLDFLTKQAEAQSAQQQGQQQIQAARNSV